VSARARLAAIETSHTLPDYISMSRKRRARSLMLVATALALLALPVRSSAQSASTATLDDPDISLLYPLAQKVQVMADVCLKDLPAQSANVPAALSAWNERHARPQLDSVIERTARRRAAMGRTFIRSMGVALFGGDPSRACADFAAFIATAEHDLGVSNPTALKNARRKLGAPDLALAATASPIPDRAQPSTVATAPTPTAAPAATPPRSTPSAAPATAPAAKTPAEVMRERIQRDTPAPATANESAPSASLADVAAPKGWIRKAMSDGSASFTVSKPDSGSAAIVIARPIPLAGLSVDNALRGWLRAQLGSRLELSLKNTVTVGRTLHGRPAAWADETADFHNSRDGLRIIGIAVAHRDNTFTPVLMFTKDDADQYHYADDFGEWFRTITLPGDVGPRWSPLAPVAPGPLQGLWFGTQMRTQLNIYGGMDMLAHRGYVALYRNGFAYRELPDGGRIDNLDAPILCGNNPRDCGTYRVEPSRVVFEWNTKFGLVETDTADIDMPRQEPPGFSYDGVSMYRVKPVTSTRLNGEFTSIDGTSSGPNGSIMVSRSINFHADGTYEATRAVGFTSTPGASGGTNEGSVVGYNPNVGPNRGTYDITGYTLTMRPVSGPVRLATIIFFDDDRPVTSVLIDDNYYKR
jgi:hypothetical protein